MNKKKDKDKFEDLDQDFKNEINGKSPEEIKKVVAKVALDQNELMKAKKLDQDLQDKLELAKEAGAVYREGTKMNKLRIGYCSQVLEDKGKA